MSDPEDRYEAIDLIVKSRADGESWFDVIHEFITQDCQGSEDTPCTCGMESMGGTVGTLQQCYDWDQNVGHGLKLIDLARVISFFADPVSNGYVDDTSRRKAIEWARDEINFEESWEDEGGSSGALQRGS